MRPCGYTDINPAQRGHRGPRSGLPEALLIRASVVASRPGREETDAYSIRASTR